MSLKSELSVFLFESCFVSEQASSCTAKKPEEKFRQQERM
jgi:hypothetical protein